MLSIKCLLSDRDKLEERTSRSNQSKECTQNLLDPNPKVSQQDLKVVYNVDCSYTSKVSHTYYSVICAKDQILRYI